MSVVVRVVALTVVWLVLWRDLSVANLTGGLLVAGLVVALVPRPPARLVLRPVPTARLAGYFVVQLVRSTLVVARTVVTPRHRLHTGFVEVPLHGCPDGLVTVIADAISLTPGTLTIEVRNDPRSLLVHALDVRNVEQVRAGVRRLERLVIDAFGDADARAGAVSDDTRIRRTS